MASTCSAYQRKKAAEIAKAIRKAARRGDCETASRLIATNQAMGASKCMRVKGFARVAKAVHNCYRRAGRPLWPSTKKTLGRSR
jgi:hypothetical protein